MSSEMLEDFKGRFASKTLSYYYRIMQGPKVVLYVRSNAAFLCNCNVKISLQEILKECRVVHYLLLVYRVAVCDQIRNSGLTGTGLEKIWPEPGRILPSQKLGRI